MNHYFTNNEDLKSAIRYLNYTYGDIKINLASDNGVFSKDRVDYGSRLLVETFLKNSNLKSGDFLDLGCGYGYIGITLSKLLNINMTMSDVNKRAIHLTKMNVKSNNVKTDIILSNGFENIAKTFDVIITNPPIRVGKEILNRLLTDSINHLKKNGELWFVMRKDQGAKSIISYLNKFKNCEIIAKSKGFFIIKILNS